jgi:ABC-2 type transport system permease protein
MVEVVTPETHGLQTLLRREHSTWWGGPRWWIQSLVGVTALCGLLAAVLFVLPTVAAAQGEDIDAVRAGQEFFFGLSPFVVAVATIILNQDTIIGEKASGIAAWILSKPVGRIDYFVSKIWGSAVGILATLLALPGLIAYGLFSLKIGGPYPIVPFLAAYGIITLHTAFYLTLTLMLGVLLDNRSRLLGITFGLLLGGAILMDFVGKAALLTPWPLSSLAVQTGLGTTLPRTMYIPIAATGLLTIGCLATGLRAARRLEL